MSSQAVDNEEKYRASPSTEPSNSVSKPWLGKLFAKKSSLGSESTGVGNTDEEDLARPTKWSMGVLNDPQTHEVPGMHFEKQE